MAPSAIAEFTRLVELSVRIGRDPLLTQGSTGNTSIKHNGVLWIKASATWLADATQKQIFIPVNLIDAKQSVRENRESIETVGQNQLQPSIETAMHAVLPHRVVIHAHSVNTIAWSIRQDAQERLKTQLDGLCWQWIPYVPSGLPLAIEIEKALFSSPDTNIFVLGNHGLVVCGEDCHSAETLLCQVERRLAMSPRHAPEADYSRLIQIADGSRWRLPDDAALHALGTDAISRMILSGGLLYPCQAIFSNSGTALPFCSVPCSNSTGEYWDRYGARSFLIIEGGTIISKTMNRAEYAMLTGLALVVQRISASAPIRYLTEIELTAVLNADAYRYRKFAANSYSNSVQTVRSPSAS